MTWNPETTTAQPPTHVIPGLTRNPVLFLSWIPDQCHLASSVTSGMTYVRLSRPMSCTSFQACPGIQKQPPPAPNPRHSGLDPESSPSLIHSRFPRFSVTNAPFVTCNMEAQFALSHSSECRRGIVPEGKHGHFPRKRSGCYFPVRSLSRGCPEGPKANKCLTVLAHPNIMKLMIRYTRTGSCL